MIGAAVIMAIIYGALVAFVIDREKCFHNQADNTGDNSHALPYTRR